MSEQQQYPEQYETAHRTHLDGTTMALGTIALTAISAVSEFVSRTAGGSHTAANAAAISATVGTATWLAARRNAGPNGAMGTVAAAGGLAGGLAAAYLGHKYGVGNTASETVMASALGAAVGVMAGAGMAATSLTHENLRVISDAPAPGELQDDQPTAIIPLMPGMSAATQSGWDDAPTAQIPTMPQYPPVPVHMERPPAQ